MAMRVPCNCTAATPGPGDSEATSLLQSHGIQLRRGHRLLPTAYRKVWGLGLAPRAGRALAGQDFIFGSASQSTVVIIVVQAPASALVS